MHHVGVALQREQTAYVTVKNKENVIATAPVLVKLVFVKKQQKVTGSNNGASLFFFTITSAVIFLPQCPMILPILSGICLPVFRLGDLRSFYASGQQSYHQA